jgi:hypothetical protein
LLWDEPPRPQCEATGIQCGGCDIAVIYWSNLRCLSEFCG